MPGIYLLVLLAVAIKVCVGFDFDLNSCNNTCQLTWTHSDPRSITYCRCASSFSLDVGANPFCQMTIENKTSYQLKVEISTEYCMTFSEHSNVSYMSRCPYSSLLFHRDENSGSIRLPPDAFELNNFVCNVSNLREHPQFCGRQRRRGMLCSLCEDGLAPAVMSYTHHCVECGKYGLLQFIGLSFIPATILCLFIIFLRVSVLVPPINAIVLFGHVIVSHVNFMPCTFFYYAQVHHLSRLVQIVVTIYGFLNMDFFVYVVPPFCISNTMSTLTAIALDYTVALYPLVLSAVIYFLIEIHDSGCRVFLWLWRPFHTCLVRFRKRWDIKGSIINAFATLYVLSFTKVISTSRNLMLTREVVSICGSWRPSYLYYNASCTIFQPCHLPYAALALLISVAVIVIPSLFIFLSACKLFRKYAWCLCNKLTLGNEVAKIFHHSFKDGTDDTLDCRWFAGFYLLCRVLIITAIDIRTTQQIQVICTVTGLILVALFQPHSRAVYNWTDAILFGGLAIVCILLPAGENRHITQILIFFIPLLLMIALVCWKFVQKYDNLVRKTKSYFCHMLEKFRNRLNTFNNGTNRAATQEREPLIGHGNSPLCIVTDDSSNVMIN